MGFIIISTGNVKSEYVSGPRYVFSVMFALVKYAEGQFGRTPSVLILFLPL